MATIYQSQSMGDAQVRIAIVDRASADLLVHRVATRGQAHGDALWFMTRDRQEAATCVFLTSQGMAQLRVCFVDSYGEAGWQRPKPAAVYLR